MLNKAADNTLLDIVKWNEINTRNTQEVADMMQLYTALDEQIKILERQMEDDTEEVELKQLED